MHHFINLCYKLLLNETNGEVRLFVWFCENDNLISITDCLNRSFRHGFLLRACQRHVGMSGLIGVTRSKKFLTHERCVKSAWLSPENWGKVRLLPVIKKKKHYLP